MRRSSGSSLSPEFGPGLLTDASVVGNLVQARTLGINTGRRRLRPRCMG